MLKEWFINNCSIEKYFIFLVFYFIICVQGQKEYPTFDLQSECSTSQYFDYSSLTCKACEINNAVPDENGICSCKLGYYINHVISSFYTCSACEINYSSTSDRKNCMKCTYGYNEENKSCTCPTGFYIVEEYDINENAYYAVCKECPENSYPTEDLSKCIYCTGDTKPALIKGKYQCSCYDNILVNNNYCIDEDSMYIIGREFSGISRITYKDIVGTDDKTSITVESDFIQQNFIEAYMKCDDGENQTACQMLGNLCVLQLYDEDSPACVAYKTAAKKNVGKSDRPNNVPYLFHGLLGGSITELLNTKMGYHFSYADNPISGYNNTLPLIVAKYDFNGTFIRYEKLTNQFQLCSEDAKRSFLFTRVGTNYKKKCSVNIADEIDKIETTYFYDIFVVDSTNALLPVPVYIKNNEIEVYNPVVDTIQKYYRRIFFFDIISSQGSDSHIIRYPKEFHIKITQGLENDEFLVPYIEVEYEEEYMSNIYEDEEGYFTKYKFEVNYISASSETTFYIAMVFMLTLGFLLGCLKAYLWTERNIVSGEGIGLKCLFKWITEWIGALYPCIFLFLLGTSIFYLIFFKNQDAIYVIVPMQGALYILFKLISILSRIFEQCRVSVFFIDWEKSRGKLYSPTNEELITAPVSVWRTFFLANQWNNIQTFRKVNIKFSIILMVFILEGLNVRYIASPHPKIGDLSSHEPTSIFLLFGLNCLCWFSICCVQMFLRWAIYGRYYKNRMLQFIDLLSLSNISMIIFDENYHGYYVHGRSVHPYADTDIIDIAHNLSKEATDLLPKRGFQNTNNILFEIYMTPEFKNVYENMFSNLQEKINNSMKKQSLTKKFNHHQNQSHGMPSFEDDNVLNAYKGMNKFFCLWLEKNIKDHPFSIEERTFVKNIFGTTPPIKDATVFIENSSSTFANVIFEGIEWSLLIFYSLLFNFVDMFFDDCITAAIVVTVVDVVILALRRHFGEFNISRTSLIDWKFLI
eukprot:jgi/Orpsp1_1/1182307/evm.model.c7180000080766.1